MTLRTELIVTTRYDDHMGYLEQYIAQLDDDFSRLLYGATHYASHPHLVAAAPASVIEESIGPRAPMTTRQLESVTVDGTVWRRMQIDVHSDRPHLVGSTVISATFGVDVEARLRYRAILSTAPLTTVNDGCGMF